MHLSSVFRSVITYIIIVVLAILKMKFVAMLLALRASMVLCFTGGQATSDGKPWPVHQIVLLLKALGHDISSICYYF